MNPQIPDYSANYSVAGPCMPCQQQAGGVSQNSMAVQAADGTKAGAPPPENSMQGGTVQMQMQTQMQPQAQAQMNRIPSAMQQPAIRDAVLGSSGRQTTAPAAQTMPITDTTQPAPMTVNSVEFLNGFLRTQIGRRVRVEFLVGTNTFTDKSGLLIGVGANYILLREAESDDILTCDFFNIKFVTIYY